MQNIIEWNNMTVKEIAILCQGIIDLYRILMQPFSDTFYAKNANSSSLVVRIGSSVMDDVVAI